MSCLPCGAKNTQQVYYEEESSGEVHQAVQTVREPVGWSCYLIFDPVSNGTFFAKWSESKVEGALAKYTPKSQRDIPGYLKNSKKPREVSRNIMVGSNEKFYDSYVGFVRDAYKYSGVLVNLNEDGGTGMRTAMAFLDNSDKVFAPQNGSKISVDQYKAVAVFSESAKIFKGVKTLHEMGFLGKVSNSPFCAKMLAK
eukprot:snap_masked-scaffold_5-processed-gene-11.10-mRNA-1 protein AED:1.00 eAED:1.00 QI:0/-1/0/0/-1/1/1/0/196